MPKFKVAVLDKISSHKTIAYSIYIGAILFFLVLILIPPIFGIGLKWNLIGEITANPELMSRAVNAIWASFAVAIFVSIIDLVAGIPIAWFITRGKSRWLNVVDTLADIPFVVPTVTLGYSLLLFWSSPQGISSLFGDSLVSPGWLLVILLHFVFSFPVVVRVMVGALLDYQRTFEEAARTLGAPPFTVDRTVTFPILKPSLIGAFVLAFARSISETGATMMVAGIFFENGAIFVKNMKIQGQLGPLVFVSLILILISCAIFGAILFFGSKLNVPIQRVWPSFERKLSSKGVAATRDTLTLLVFSLLVIIPSLFVALPTFNAIMDGTINNAVSGSGIWQEYWSSLGLSYLVGGLATLLSILAGLPMAVLIARKRLGRSVSAVLNILINIPIIVPSTALGVSLSIFWTSSAFVPEIMLLILAHLSITYSYFVRSLVAAIERTDIELENAARIHGAKPFTVFRTIILPLTKYSLLAGAIMVLTRSVSETGATLAVVSQLRTVPVLLVEWLSEYQNNQLTTITPSDIGLGCGILIVLSFIVLLFLKLGAGRKAVY
ncbi:MAG: ABC transporter permease subunit [Candidatus Bathyarchaeota archaeon]|nr:ABC transporter permease subunit [Candidatus Bathyarchaeota archaeon]MDH5495456.1 ABC transporter permease subunit [Candidatus Bathyarchaeota archaeon]